MAFYRFCTARQIWFLACIDPYNHTCKCRSLFSKARLVCLSPNCRFLFCNWWQIWSSRRHLLQSTLHNCATNCNYICTMWWRMKLRTFLDTSSLLPFLNTNYLHLLLNHIFHHTSISIMHLSMAQVQVCMQSFQLQYTCHKLLPLLLFQNAING